MSTDGYCCACGRFRTLVYLGSMCRDCLEEYCEKYSELERSND